MQNIFLTADTHFGHAGILNMVGPTGARLRPFATPQEMDEELIARWNAVVKPQDKVYHLGDVAMARRHIATVSRCNGHKRLIMGNHDLFKLKDYTPHFERIRGVAVLPAQRLVLTHIPLHPDQVGRFGLNVHGHLHAHDLGSPLHVCVSVERTGLAPINIEELPKLHAWAQKEGGATP